MAETVRMNANPLKLVRDANAYYWWSKGRLNAAVWKWGLWGFRLHGAWLPWERHSNCCAFSLLIGGFEVWVDAADGPE